MSTNSCISNKYHISRQHSAAVCLLQHNNNNDVLICVCLSTLCISSFKYDGCTAIALSTRSLVTCTVISSTVKRSCYPTHTTHSLQHNPLCITPIPTHSTPV